MRKIMFCAASLALTGLGLSAAMAARSTLSPAATRGRQVFMADGCPQCHGVTGQGTVAPKIAPNPLPLQFFTLQLRNPRGIMPVYTAVILPDEQVADIYAYLSGIPKIKSPADIPLLSQ